MAAKVTVEFKGKIEIPCQGWTDDTRLEQVKKQAKREIQNWLFLVQKGAAEPERVNWIKAEVTEVTLDV